MYFKQIYTPGLALCSYVVGGKNECLVVDPPRDISRCLEAAREFGLPITGVLETHLHADFVSGHLELAHATGAVIYASRSSRCLYQHIALTEGKPVDHDTLRIQFMDTPGHTPESALFLISDLERTDEPVMVFSGDTLLVGDVGRPDLFPGQKEELVRMLYQSLRKIENLGDNLELYPAHGAGSLCGRSLSAKLSSTVGTEKKFNYAFSIRPESRFKNAILTGMPEAPDHFSRCSEINRQGPALVSHLDRPMAFSPGAFRKLAHEGHLVLDVRDNIPFVSAHIPGAYAIPVNSNFSTFAGWVLPPDVPLMLVGDDPEQVEDALIKLRRVGLDLVAGFLEGGMERWINEGAEIDSLQSISVHHLRERLPKKDAIFVDARLASEWEEGHIEGTVHVPAPRLRTMFEDLDRDHPVVVFCSTSKRSVLGASILKRRGFTNVTQVMGGITGWRNAGYPLVKE